MVAPTDVPDLIYKVASAAAVADARAAGRFPTMPVDAADGYVHFSTAAQLPDTLRLYFAGQDDLVLLAVRSADLGSALVWEPSRGGQLFPHAYGAVSPAAVAWTAVISVSPDGACPLPPDVR
jgi:uncharacterized protein (DUF952 family)